MVFQSCSFSFFSENFFRLSTRQDYVVKYMDKNLLESRMFVHMKSRPKVYFNPKKKKMKSKRREKLKRKHRTRQHSENKVILAAVSSLSSLYVWTEYFFAIYFCNVNWKYVQVYYIHNDPQPHGKRPKHYDWLRCRHTKHQNRTTKSKANEKGKICDKRKQLTNIKSKICIQYRA